MSAEVYARFKVVLRLLLPMVVVCFSKAQADEILPWPFGSECPLPAFSSDTPFESYSATSGFEQKQADEFVIQLVGEIKDGPQILKISRSLSGVLVGLGHGLLYPNDRIVRAYLKDLSIEATQNSSAASRWYGAWLRAYPAVVNSSCEKGQVLIFSEATQLSEPPTARHLLLKPVLP